jgi:rhodanese-related sulfurtransferase
MSYANAKPADAKALLDGAGGVMYLDVRTPEEFQSGHVPGAYNVPIAMRDRAGRMTPNDDFVAVVKKSFPLDSKLIVGCASGVRSVQACRILEAEGYAALTNMACGYSGARDATGAIVEKGWQASGFPCETAGLTERTYRKLWERK